MVKIYSTHMSFYVGFNGISLTPFYDLVNIKMYPHFEQEMAMALGQEKLTKSISSKKKTA